MEILAVKTCRKCGKEKSLSDFHKQAARPDGHQVYCRPCNSAASAARKRERRLADPEYAGELAAYKAEHYAANREEHKAAAQQWRAANPEKLRAQQASYRDAYPERRRASSEKYRRDNPEKRKANWDAWYAVNKEAVAARSALRRAANPEKQIESSRRWRQANPGAVREFRRRRSARLKAATTVPFTMDQLSARMAAFGDKCWMCRGPFEHVDHVKPLSKNGPHMLANLRPACSSCNQKKQAKWYGVAGLHRFIKN